MVAQRRPLTTGESSRGMATSLTVRPSIMVIILAGRDRRETACRDGPCAVVEASDVDVVCKSDGIGQRVTPVATGSGRRVASVTSICIGCSMDNRLKSCGAGSDAASVGPEGR
jgi:hypothetical protein